MGDPTYISSMVECNITFYLCTYARQLHIFFHVYKDQLSTILDLSKKNGDKCGNPVKANGYCGVHRNYPDLLKFSKGSTNGKPTCPWYVGRKDERIRKCARDCIQIHPNDHVEQGNCQKDKRLCFKVCASKMS